MCIMTHQSVYQQLDIKLPLTSTVQSCRNVGTDKLLVQFIHSALKMVVNEKSCD